MKICLVSCEYPPFHGGGIGTYAANISRYLAEAGHEVHVVANRWADFEPAGQEHFEPLERHGNLWIHRVDALRSDYGPRPAFAHPADPLGQVCRNWDCSLFWAVHVAEQLERIVREHGIQVVEYPECFAEGYVAMRRRKLGLGLDLPMTLTMHSPIFEVTVYNLYRQYRGWFQRRNMMEEFCIRHTDMLSCPSRHLAEIVAQRLGLDLQGRHVDVIHNPMDFDSLGDLSGLPPEDLENPTLLFVGRIEPRKGVKFFVDAAVELMGRHPRLKTVLIGRDCEAGEVPGMMTSYLWQRIPSELHHRVAFAGLMPRDQIFARYASATCCVFAPPWDNFPNTCCEAMACGGCVVAGDYSGMSEMVVHGESGLLFESRNHQALVAAVEQVLAHPELRAKFRQQAPGRIREVCDPGTSVRRRIAHYERTIEAFEAKRRVRLPRVPAGRASVSLLVPNHTGVEQQLTSIRSAQRAAERAGCTLDVSVIGTRVHGVNTSAPAGVFLHNTSQWEDTSAHVYWAERCRELGVDYLLALWPGETLDADYFTRTLDVLQHQPRVAWATTWAVSSSEHWTHPFAGFDFTVPLEMLYYHPVPFAVVRREAYEAVGGINPELPHGWRQWDLWLALAEAGWDAVVVPEWHAKYLPEAGNDLWTPPHEKQYELILQAISRRNRKLFAEHGAEMWINQVTNPVYQLPPLPKVKHWFRKLVRDAVNKPKRMVRWRS